MKFFLLIVAISGDTSGCWDNGLGCGTRGVDVLESWVISGKLVVPSVMVVKAACSCPRSCEWIRELVCL